MSFQDENVTNSTSRTSFTTSVGWRQGLRAGLGFDGVLGMNTGYGGHVISEWSCLVRDVHDDSFIFLITVNKWTLIHFLPLTGFAMFPCYYLKLQDLIEFNWCLYALLKLNSIIFLTYYFFNAIPFQCYTSILHPHSCMTLSNYSISLDLIFLTGKMKMVTGQAQKTAVSIKRGSAWSALGSEADR